MATRMNRWTEIEKPGDAPRDPGVYALLRGDELLYVGSTCSLRKRLYHYSRDRRFQGARIRVRPCSRYGEWLMVELRLIWRLRPTYNARPPLLVQEGGNG